MRLYMFEHCSLCFRVRMMAALKRLHLQETVVLDDDTDTMVGLVGRRQIPILVKDDGEPMLESMDMVQHVESRGEPVLTGPERSGSRSGRTT
jgi:glutaredoxin 2